MIETNKNSSSFDFCFCKFKTHIFLFRSWECSYTELFRSIIQECFVKMALQLFYNQLQLFCGYWLMPHAITNYCNSRSSKMFLIEGKLRKLVSVYEMQWINLSFNNINKSGRITCLYCLHQTIWSILNIFRLTCLLWD